MTQSLEDSKMEKEINKFQKHLFMFFKIGILKNFAIFTGNTCVEFSSCNFSKKRLQHKSFPVNIAKHLTVTFL